MPKRSKGLSTNTEMTSATRATSRGSALSDRLPRAALELDLTTLAHYLTRTHPEPYRRGGGRVAFNARLARLRASIPAAGLTREAFLRHVAPLVASLGDGHTTIYLPATTAEVNRRVWVDLDLAGEEVFVRRSYGANATSLVGRRLVAVEGVPLQILADRMEKLRGADNSTQNWVHLMDAFRESRWLARLLERPALPTSLRLSLRDADGGAVQEHRVPVGPQAPTPVSEPKSRFTIPKPNAAGIAWTILDGGEQGAVALLRISSLMRYREAFEVWRKAGFQANLGSHLDTVALAAVGKASFASLKAVGAKIAAIPSATETLLALRRAMVKGKVTRLIVDVRDNRGGNSFFTAIAQAVLFGPETLDEATPSYQVPRISSLYFENYKRRSVTQELRRRGLRRLGDYDFSQFFRYRARGKISKERKESVLAEAKGYSPTFARFVESPEGRRGIAPRHIAVVTSARTYSAAFGLATMLYRRGAQVVGVAAAQAGNCYIDSLGYRLQHSGLQGTISYKKSVRFPDDPRVGESLSPDYPLRYRYLAARGFDPHASLRLAQEALTHATEDRTLKRAPKVRWRGKSDGALALLTARFRLEEVEGKAAGTETKRGSRRRLLRILEWVYRRSRHDRRSCQARSDALSILAGNERGERSRCVEYALVLAQAFRAMGYCARVVWLQGKSAHVLAEVWAPWLNKWVLADGQFAAVVQRSGKLLSALEVVNALRKDKGVGLQSLLFGRRDPRYLRWLSAYTESLMVPLDMSYGHAFDRLLVWPLEPSKAARKTRPWRKPSYLRQTHYLIAKKPAWLYPSCQFEAKR